MKRCSTCKEFKPAECFTRDKNSPDGLCIRCKACRHAHYVATAEQVKQRVRERVQQNPEAKKESDRRYYLAHRDEVLARVNEHYQRNHAQRLEYSRDYRIRYTDKVRRAIRAWRDRNPESFSVATQRRRALKRQSPGTFTRAEWKALCARYGHRCLCCGEKKRLTVDHVVPLSQGGANTIDNIQPLCGTCNQRKYTKHIDYRPKEA